MRCLSWNNQIKWKKVKCFVRQHKAWSWPVFPRPCNSCPPSCVSVCSVGMVVLWCSLSHSPGSQLNLHTSVPSAHRLLQPVYPCLTLPHHQIIVSDTVKARRPLKLELFLIICRFCVLYLCPGIMTYLPAFFLTCLLSLHPSSQLH